MGVLYTCLPRLQGWFKSCVFSTRRKGWYICSRNGIVECREQDVIELDIVLLIRKARSLLLRSNSGWEKDCDLKVITVSKTSKHNLRNLMERTWIDRRLTLSSFWLRLDWKTPKIKRWFGLRNRSLDCEDFESTSKLAEMRKAANDAVDVEGYATTRDWL